MKLSGFESSGKVELHASEDTLVVLKQRMTAMELLRARLVRRTTCSNGCRCDYTICGDRDAWCQEYPEYRDEAGYRRNTP